MASVMQNTRVRIGIVNVPVAVYKASGSNDIKFERRVAATGGKVKRLEVDETTGEPVSAEEIMRGVNTGDGFVPLPADELEKIEATIKARDAIDVAEFMPVRSLAPLAMRFDGCYYLGETGEKPDRRALRTLYTAMRREKVMGIGKWVARSRESLIALIPTDKGFSMVKLVFADALREPEQACVRFLTEKAEKEPIDQMRAVIQAHSGDGRMVYTAVDEAIPLKEKLVANAMKGEKIEFTPQTEAIDSFMEQLEAAVAAAK